MSELQNKINAFVKLGTFLGQFNYPNYTPEKIDQLNEDLFTMFVEKIKNAKSINGWFTQENICFSLQHWSRILTKDNIEQWLSKYALSAQKSKKVALIMAGNIPLVGMHDLLCTLITGHTAIVKLSSNDTQLIPMVVRCLISIEPSFRDKVIFTDGQLKDFDAVIATGSNNTARYFEYYFKNVPSVIRKNRNSIAVLRGNETNDQLKMLGEDIFRYYGLGCRSVSKLLIPDTYKLDILFNALYDFHTIINQTKYANNYDYNKAVYLMSQFAILDNGFLILKEDPSYASPIASLFYETYSDISEVYKKIEVDKDQLQCVVSDGLLDNEVSFGQTQLPPIDEYADGVDTIEFLLKI